MGLNISKGNMYQFIDATWNTVKGKCPHDCSFCYMKRFGKQNPLHFDEKELKTDLGKNRFIFVGSSCDMWADDIPGEWIIKTLEHCSKFDNTYLFQSKNPKGFVSLGTHMPEEIVLCTSLESNIHYPKILKNAPSPADRAYEMMMIPAEKKYVTIEPIMEFDLFEVIGMVNAINPLQVTIGADSDNNDLPEPSREKVLTLIVELEKFTKVVRKKNLKRITG